MTGATEGWAAGLATVPEPEDWLPKSGKVPSAWMAISERPEETALTPRIAERLDARVDGIVPRPGLCNKSSREKVFPAWL